MVTRKYSNYKGLLNGYTRVEQNGKFGVVDSKDNLRVPIKYSQITEAITSDNGHLDDGFHVWDADGRVGVVKVINGKGKEIVPCAGNYDRIWGYESYGVIVVKNGKQGCIKENGATFCRPVYDGHINGLKRIGFVKNSATSNDVTVDIYDYNGKYLTSVNVGNNGSSNLLEIAGGATITINSLSVNARNGQGNRLLVRDASTLILTNGTTGVQNTGILTVSGEGTKMFLRQITVESGGRLEILDGAVSTNRSALAIGSNGRGGAEMIISNATHHSATIVNVGNYTSNCVLRVMDGATLSCPDSFLDIGSFNSASNNTAIIEGEGSSAVFSRFRIGGLSKDGIMIVRNGGTAYSGTYQLGSTAGCLRPRLEVLDGGVVTTRGNSASLVFGTANPGASNGVLRVRNGRVDFPLNNSSIALRNAGTLIIEGTNSTITVRDFWSAGSSVIEFNPPPLRCETPPAITVASALTFDDTVTLRVPAESAYRCAVGGGGTYTVFEHTTKDITDFFGALDLPEGVTAEVDGNRITVTIPNRAGTVFLVH